MAGNRASVEFRNVSRRYGKVAAVDDVSFTIESGTLVTLLGPSGCGKTTTLRMIAGLEVPTSGTILIGDVDVTKQPPTDRDVSMVFQSYALFPHMNVGENVGYGLAAGKLPKVEQRHRVEAALHSVGLDGFADRLPSQLSGGQQQRVAVARALVLEPQVLLFDEPLSNLDAKLRRHMRDEIRDLQQKLGLTAVYVTHDQEEAMAVSDRIVLMHQGHIAQAGTPEELYERPANRFVADFIGGANLVDCDVLSVAGGWAQVALGPARLSLSAGGLGAGPATLAIRHDGLRLGAVAGADLKATVRKSIYLGGHFEYTVASAVGDLFVIDHEGEAAQVPGTEVGLRFRGRGVALVARA